MRAWHGIPINGRISKYSFNKDIVIKKTFLEIQNEKAERFLMRSAIF
jgi:hypothetical protein